MSIHEVELVITGSGPASYTSAGDLVDHTYRQSITAAGTAAGVTSIPTLGFYRAGERVDMLIGAHSKPVIAAKIEELLV